VAAVARPRLMRALQSHRVLAALAVSTAILCLGAATVLVPSRQPAPRPKARTVQAAQHKAPQPTAQQPVAPQPVGPFAVEPTWQQDFSGMPSGRFTDTAWHHDTDPDVPGRNEEAQAYTNNDPRNIFVQDGRLVLAARRAQYSYPNDSEVYQYTSSRIDTRDSFSFEYGKVVARMKLPRGRGTWPAWWFLSANQVYTNRLHPSDADWEQERFYMHDGELDGLESYGQTPDMVEGTLYTFNKTYEQDTPLPDARSAFHDYGVEVLPDKVTWTIDGKPYYSVQKSSANPDAWPIGGGNKFYMILNLALGGTGGGTIDDSSEAGWRLEIEHLKYYPYIKQ
jgi:beta-glucanase (GH16 family)